MDLNKDKERATTRQRKHLNQLKRTIEGIRRRGYRLAIIPIAAKEEEDIIAGRNSSRIGQYTKTVCKRRAVAVVSRESRRINRRQH